VLAERLAALYLATGRDDDADRLAAEVLRAGVDANERGRMLLLNNRLATLNNLGLGAEFRAAVDRALILSDQAGSARAGWLLGAAAMGLFDFGDWDGALLHLRPRSRRRCG
jgi:hypothetical protein